ncbi:hypothetical protein KORDIASMS9_03776 [Kordia sp. SMS9]|nr:hypothetical protein KORDIASMS9_03776 [Kordia sp. SMS9]
MYLRDDELLSLPLRAKEYIIPNYTFKKKIFLNSYET